MKLHLRFFASVREKLDCSTLELNLDDASISATQVRQRLIDQGSPWDQALSFDRVLRMAVNQVMIEHDVQLKEGDELAFFPPVTGG
ncbi:molybdopterin converting factor subunit 1 [Undibacterium cyanobacteriorum]|uniref:Molybdopterin converting factor subunit 1 n=1 Tax=Undibacterium cyanobacteriorum TaxID=3073561 RepID=A0ABY9REZ0_9BURK|nr:molybdopterin converting factor subunit 1 [Undibacterium sp. 20NA77.5]WMW79501.1 molybdopterin converting factor subunit 1 [Undibacterium sp. 20NA77.5]